MDKLFIDVEHEVVSLFQDLTTLVAKHEVFNDIVNNPDMSVSLVQSWNDLQECQKLLGEYLQGRKIS